MSSPAVRHAHDAMLVGTPDGRILHANPAACLMFGRSEDELRRVGGAVVIERVHPGFAAGWARRVETGVFRGEMVCRRSDGSLFETEVSTRLFTGSDGQQYTSISIRDITERRATEAALSTNELRYRTLIETLDEGIVYQDAGGSILASNPAAERILGLSADQLAGRTSLDPRWRSIHEDGSPFPGQDHPAMVSLRTGQPSTGIMGVHKPDGTLTWISVRARPVLRIGAAVPDAVVATFTDITEQRATITEYERVAHHLRSRTALLAMAERIATETDADNLRSVLALGATAISGAEHCAFFRWNPEDRTLTTISSTTPGQPVGRVHPGLSGALPRGLSGMAIAQQRPVVVIDYAVELADQPEANGHRLGMRAAVAIPLHYEGRTLGVLMVWSTQQGFTFSDKAVENLRLLGGLASAAFIGLERTQLATIAMSARALMHSVNNHLAFAAGMLEVGVDADRLSPEDRATLADVNAHLDAAAAQIVQFGRVNRIHTVPTPAGTALDIGASTEH